MIIRLAWRNIFRNGRRTFLAGLAIGIGLAAMMFTDALMLGMERNMIDAATGTFLGQAQIHESGFRESFDVERTIGQLPDVMAELEMSPHVAGFAPRTQTFAMITSPAEASAVVLYGIDPIAERAVSKIEEAVEHGAYLRAGDSPEGDGSELLIGARLAEILQAEIGDRLVITVSEAGSGELRQEMLRLGGIFRFGIRSLDDGITFVHLETGRRLLGLEREAHEIAITFDEVRQATDETATFWDQFNQLGNEALGWDALLPELKAVLDMSQISMFIVIIFLFIVVALSIMNTLFMSLHERVFEFGVLRALGTSPGRVAALIFMEACGLAIVAGVIGVALGLAVTAWFSAYGIDYVGIEYSGITFQELMYPIWRVRQVTIYPFAVLCFALVAAIYPAIYAARLRPAEALRRHD